VGVGASEPALPVLPVPSAGEGAGREGGEEEGGGGGGAGMNRGPGTSAALPAPLATCVLAGGDALSLFETNDVKNFL
jgi:hypothetical protein